MDFLRSLDFAGQLSLGGLVLGSIVVLMIVLAWIGNWSIALEKRRKRNGKGGPMVSRLDMKAKLRDIRGWSAVAERKAGKERR